MDSDGLLIKTKTVKSDNPDQLTELRIGVIVQSEKTTSLSKPNPFGKALVGKLPLGIWVDVKDKASGACKRVRLDHAYVLFVLPTPAASAQAKVSAKAAQNVENALAAADDVHVLRLRQGSAASDMAKEITKQARAWLVGPGRPRAAI
jgi:hypothetical protein